MARGVRFLLGLRVYPFFRKTGTGIPVFGYSPFFSASTAVGTKYAASKILNQVTVLIHSCVHKMEVLRVFGWSHFIESYWSVYKYVVLLVLSSLYARSVRATSCGAYTNTNIELLIIWDWSAAIYIISTRSSSNWGDHENRCSHHTSHEIQVFSFFVFFLRLVASRLILVSPSSLLLSIPCPPRWRFLLFCYFVSALHPPPALLVSLTHAHSPCVLSSCLRCWCWLFFFFFPSCPYSISIWTSLVFILLFLVGTMLSPRFWFLLRLV